MPVLVKQVAQMLHMEVTDVLTTLQSLSIEGVSEDGTIEQTDLVKLMGYVKTQKKSSVELTLTNKNPTKLGGKKISVRKKRVESPVSQSKLKAVKDIKAVATPEDSELTSNIKKAQNIHKKRAEAEKEKQEDQLRMEQELARPEKLKKEQEIALAEQKEKKGAGKTQEPQKKTETKSSSVKKDKVSSTKSRTAPIEAGSSIDKNKNKSSKSKVLKARAEKDWHKHSQRPQDFSLNDPDLVDSLSKNKKAQMQNIHKKNKHKFVKPNLKQQQQITIDGDIAIADLAQLLALKPKKLLNALSEMGEEVSYANGVKKAAMDILEQDLAVLLVEHLGHSVVVVAKQTVIDEIKSDRKVLTDKAKTVGRPPVVTVMGHVDHGKTSLLDYIRKAKVAEKEAGGITQHIGAYEVKRKKSSITFIDTPGHSAFSAMRARGANNTDLIILVVAADDGVMPQTKEAIEHAKNAGVPFIVAVNKMDKEGASMERVMTDLNQHGVVSEQWGGDVQFVPISALKGDGIDELLDLVDLQAEVLELQCFIDASGEGTIIESKLDKGKGPVVTLLIKNGQLKKGDTILAGSFYGRVRSMVDCTGVILKQASASQPVEILGLNGVPNAGEEFMVLQNEKIAKKASAFYEQQKRQKAEDLKQRMSMENMFEQLQNKEKSKVSILVKSDVQGSLEALQKAVLELSNDEVNVDIVYSSVGGINESDINLAVTTSSLIFGFNVRADSKAKKLAEQTGIDFRYFDTIYKVVDDIQGLVGGLIKPELQQQIMGTAEVRDIFNSPRYGKIAGCYVTDGTIYRNDPIRVLRDNVVIYTGVLESLRRIKEDVPSVRNGLECGIGVKDYNDIQVGDQIEVYREKEVIPNKSQTKKSL